MAYTTAPELNAQKNVFVPAVTEGKEYALSTRAGVFTQNFIIADVEGGPVLESRPSTSVNGATNFFPTFATNVTALYAEAQFTFFSTFVGGFTRVYVTSTDGTIVTTELHNTPVNQRVYFTTFTKISGEVLVIWSCGQSAGAFSTTTLTNTPISPTIFANQGCPVFLDGFLFWYRALTNEIYHSNFDDPFTYTPGNFITANIESGVIVNLAKLKNYLVAFKTTGIEFFYNAGNPSGSVLARNDSFFTTVNIIGANYISYQDALYFYGGDVSSSRRGLYKLTATGQTQLFVNPAWDVDAFFSPFNIDVPVLGTLSCFNVFELRGNTYISCNRTVSLTDYRPQIGPGYWFDLKREIFLFHTVLPMFSPRRNNLASSLFISNINQATNNFSLFETNSAARDQNTAVNVPYTNFIVYRYQTGSLNHETLNFKTCNQIKIRTVRVGNTASIRNPTCTVEWANNSSGSIFPPRTATVTSTDNETESTRRDYIIRRLGRYRERTYRFTFTGESVLTPSESLNPIFRLYGFEFNITVGTN